MFKRILVTTDGSEPAARAIERAIELGNQLKAKLAMLHVVDVTAAFVPELGATDQNIIASLRKTGTRLLSQTLLKIDHSSEIERLMVEGEPAETIICAAREWNADLIVMGADSRGRPAHFLLGNTADAVIRRAGCPVMTVRADSTKITPSQVHSTVVASRSAK